MYHCDHLSGDKAVWRRMPMPGGRSRHQLIPLPRHFHLSGLTACITHPQGRVVCMSLCVCACVIVRICVWAGDRTKDLEMSRIMCVGERQTETLKETLQLEDLVDVEFPDDVKSHL